MSRNPKDPKSKRSTKPGSSIRLKSLPPLKSARLWIPQRTERGSSSKYMVTTSTLMPWERDGQYSAKPRFIIANWGH
jgi:hypothetical protein